MKKIILGAVVLALSANAFAHGREDSERGRKWGSWVQSASVTANRIPHFEERRSRVAAVIVPAGTATYAGTTSALVSDTSSGTRVVTASSGNVNLNVTFSGAGTTTETGSITGLTGVGGAAVGDLAFTGAGRGSEFKGTVTSANYPYAAAVYPARATGTGKIEGKLSAPVVTATTVDAPLTARGEWNFKATNTLNAKGTFNLAR